MIETKEEYEKLLPSLGPDGLNDVDAHLYPNQLEAVRETIEALMEVARAAETYDDQKLEETLKALPDWMKKKR